MQVTRIPAAELSAAEGERAALSRADSLRINEIFLSLQGETSRTGLPTVFIRLTGCPLRCGYCDTAYAFHEGLTRSLDDILGEVAGYGVRHVCVTGGEPLAQRNCLKLLTRLADAGHSVSLETSGALDIGDVDSRVSRIMDLKTPDSGEAARNRWENIPLLTGRDELKFVLCSEADYAWAVDQIRQHGLADRCPVLLSPSFGQLNPALLAQWILRDRLPVRMQVQLHKVLWGEARGK